MKTYRTHTECADAYERQAAETFAKLNDRAVSGDVIASVMQVQALLAISNRLAAITDAMRDRL